MPYSLYVCLQDENKIAAFTIDTDTGRLTPQAEVLAPGGPSGLAISPDRHVLYVGHRVLPAISSFWIDHATGGLTLQGRVSPEHPPTFLATDRTGRYLLSAYYQGGYAAVIRLQRMARWALQLSTGWPQPRALMPYRPTPPTALPSCRTSPVSTITSWNLRRRPMARM
jgi:6-phosphogluconolactonase (cycloisomerase 2 family)